MFTLKPFFAIVQVCLLVSKQANKQVCWHFRYSKQININLMAYTRTLSYFSVRVHSTPLLFIYYACRTNVRNHHRHHVQNINQWIPEVNVLPVMLKTFTNVCARVCVFFLVICLRDRLWYNNNNNNNRSEQQE